MYGYVVVNQKELKFREYDMYRSYYCGLCDVLKDEFGFKGQMSISYDMTFLVLLLSGLYEPETKHFTAKCVAHPVRSHEVRRNAVTEYVADMNVLMTYYKCMDDWVDEKKITRRVIASGLAKAAERVMAKYGGKAQAIKESLEALSEAERKNETNIDQVSAHFGNIMGVMTAMKEDEWKDTLYRLGFSLGKFIYILDAYEDLEGDFKKGRYNMLKKYKDLLDFDQMCENVLNAVMAECARQFETLPIIQDAEILRNIIYSGVWTRFEIVRSKKAKEQENKK